MVSSAGIPPVVSSADETSPFFTVQQVSAYDSADSDIELVEPRVKRTKLQKHGDDAVTEAVSASQGPTSADHSHPAALPSLLPALPGAIGADTAAVGSSAPETTILGDETTVGAAPLETSEGEPAVGDDEADGSSGPPLAESNVVGSEKDDEAGLKGDQGDQGDQGEIEGASVQHAPPKTPSEPRPSKRLANPTSSSEADAAVESSASGTVAATGEASKLGKKNDKPNRKKSTESKGRARTRNADSDWSSSADDDDNSNDDESEAGPALRHPVLMATRRNVDSLNGLSTTMDASGELVCLVTAQLLCTWYEIAALEEDPSSTEEQHDAAFERPIRPDRPRPLSKPAFSDWLRAKFADEISQEISRFFLHARPLEPQIYERMPPLQELVEPVLLPRIVFLVFGTLEDVATPTVVEYTHWNDALVATAEHLSRITSEAGTSLFGARPPCVFSRPPRRQDKRRSIRSGLVVHRRLEGQGRGYRREAG